MKKKTLAVYALIGALTTGTSLTSCIDNDESLSVTQLREAKAQQLKAQAEAELIRSNAEAALLNAEAELNRLKAEAQKLENEANKAKYEAEIEAVRAKAELELIKAQKKIQELQHEMDNAAFEQYNKLFKEYNRALRKLFELKNQCLGTKTLIAKTEAEVISAKAAILEERMRLESELAQDEIMLALLKDPQYQSIDNKAMKEKIQKEEVQLQLDKQKFESSSTNLDFLAAFDKFEEAQNYYDEVSEMADDLNDLSSENNMPDIVIRSFDQHIEINSLLVLPIMRVRMTLLTLLEQVKYIHIPVYKYRINEAAKIAMYNKLDQKIEKKTQSLGTPNDDASKNTAYGKLALCQAELTKAQALPETTAEEKAAKKAAVQKAEIAVIEAQNAIEKQQGEINKSIGDKSRVDSLLAIVEKLLDAPEKYKAAVAEINPLADKVCDEYRVINQREVALEAMNELMDATMVDLTSMIAQLESKIAIEKAKLEEYKTVDLSNEEYLQLLKDTLKEYEAMIEQMEKKLDVIKAKIDAAMQENK